MREFSYGIIPLKYNHASNEWDVLLVQHQGGYWAFPKGHANKGETPKETAARELQEETGLIIERFLLEDILKENYVFFFQKKRILKTVFYYIAAVTGEVVIQTEEISGSRWIPLEKAAEHMTFTEGKNLCVKTIELVRNVNKE